MMENGNLNTPQPESDIEFWNMSKNQLMNYFNQNETGFTDSEVRILHQKHGFNELKEEEGESILEKILEQFQDTLVRILLLAATISFVIAFTSGNFELFVFIYIINIIVFVTNFLKQI